MSCGGPLSAVMMIAGAGLVPGLSIPGIGSALGVNSTLTSALSSFSSLPIVGQFSDIVTSASSLLSGDVLNSLRTMGADILPALTNSIPSSFTSALSLVAPGGVFDGGFTGLLSQTATGIMGGSLGDLSQFSQIFNSAQGYISQANQFINSALNIDAISATFGSLTGGMDNLLTGSFSQITEAFGAFGSDLSQLGSLINLNNLTSLGDPYALIKQVASVGGITPSIESALRLAGVDSSALINLASGNFTNISGTADKLLYQALTQVTGSELQQVKNILGVTATGITTMADLLDISKILPTSYTTLTMLTPDGLKGIYATADAVNANIEKYLIDPTAPEYTGDDPIIRARLGLDQIT
jgi:hypothetical protein